MSIVQEIIDDGGYRIDDYFIDPSKWTRPQVSIYPTGGIIHWTGNIGYKANAVANRNFFNRRTGTYGSAHIIGDCESIIAVLPYLPGSAEMAYHVGANTYFTSYFGTYPNSRTLGYEMCVNRDGNFRESYKRAVWTMAYWCFIYGWNPQTDVMRHWDITHKDCPLPFLDLIFDDYHCRSKGWSDEEIQWMRENLHIDGVQGEALWQQYRSEVCELVDIMNKNNGELKLSEEEEDNMAMNLPDWAWNQAYNIVGDAYNKGLIDWVWCQKIIDKSLTAAEYAHINAVIAAREKGINIDKQSI
jgi:hypothetical protein